MSHNIIIESANNLLTPIELAKAVENGFDLEAAASGNLASILDLPTVSTVSFNLLELATLAEELSLAQGGTSEAKVRGVLAGRAGQPALLHLKKVKSHTDGHMYEPISLARWVGGYTWLFKGGLHRLTSLVALLQTVAETKGKDIYDLLEATNIPVMVYTYSSETLARMSAITDNGSRSVTAAEKAQVKSHSLFGVDTSDIQAVTYAIKSGALPLEEGMYFLMGQVYSGNTDAQGKRLPITDNVMLKMTKTVVKKLINLTVNPCKYAVSQDGTPFLLNEKSALKYPVYRLATLGGDVELTIPDSDIDAYAEAYLPETDSEGITLVSDSQYNEDNFKLSVTVEGDIDWFAEVLTTAFNAVAGDYTGNIAYEHATTISKDVITLLSNTTTMPKRAKSLLFPVSNYKSARPRSAK